ncbi:hypothetical protein M407DRAFT_246447, partial [Tulasnella calospora MUT 4182]
IAGVGAEVISTRHISRLLTRLEEPVKAGLHYDTVVWAASALIGVHYSRRFS